MIRFSLTTLLLVAFWLAALLLVWAWRQPWRCVGDHSVSPPGWARYSSISPDNSRRTFRRENTWGIEWYYDDYINYAAGAAPNVIYQNEEASAGRVFAMFVNDSTIVVTRGSPLRELIYQRRFPEWWWGHFYRPETWLVLAVTAVLVWRAVRAARSANAADAARRRSTQLPRRFWQIHLSTAVLLMFVAGCFLWLNLRQHESVGKIVISQPLPLSRGTTVVEPDINITVKQGWPLDFRAKERAGPAIAQPTSRGRAVLDEENGLYLAKSILLTNIAICIALLILVIFVCEWHIRRRESRP